MKSDSFGSKKQKDGALLAEVRNGLVGLIWDYCQKKGFVGRCWGKRSNSMFPGSHITLCDGKCLVSIYQENGDGSVRLAVFNLPTNIGDQILPLLVEDALLQEGFIDSRSL